MEAFKPTTNPSWKGCSLTPASQKRLPPTVLHRWQWGEEREKERKERKENKNWKKRKTPSHHPRQLVKKKTLTPYTEEKKNPERTHKRTKGQLLQWIATYPMQKEAHPLLDWKYHLLIYFTYLKACGPNKERKAKKSEGKPTHNNAPKENKGK